MALDYIYSRRPRRLVASIDKSESLIADWSQVPDLLYHATLWENLDDIQKTGLGNVSQQPDREFYDGIYRGNGFFVSPDYNDAAMYLSDYDPDEVVVRVIPKRILSPGKLYYDTNNEDNIEQPTSWFYKGIIQNPQRYVKILDW